MPTLKAAIDARGAVHGERAFRRAQQGISQSARSIGTDIKRVDTQIKAVGATASSAKRLLGGMFSVIAGGSAIAGLRTVTKTIASFEHTMKGVQAYSGATAEEFNRMAKAARELGATTKFSAKQAADSLQFLAIAGYDTNQALSALPHTLSLASSGLIDLGTAGDIASNVVSGFGMKAEETKRVVDVLANTFASANTNATELGEAMKYVAPLAASLGISVEETAAAIGVLGDNAIKGSMAGTNLKGIFANLLRPASDDAKAAIKALGLSVEQVSPKFKKPIEIFAAFSKAGLTSAKNADKAVSIFGKLNVAAALSLTRMVEKLNDLTYANNEASKGMGRSGEIAKTMSDSTTGAFLSLISATQELMLVWGDSGLGLAMRNILDFATEVVRDLAGVSEKFGTIRESAKEVARVLEGLGGAISVLVTFNLAAWLGRAAIAMKAFTLAALSNPFIFVASAVTAAVAALIIYKDEMITIGDTTVTVGATVKGVFTGIKLVLEGVKDTLADLGNSFHDFMVEDVGGASDTLFKFLGVGMTDSDIAAIDANRTKQPGMHHIAPGLPKKESGILENIIIAEKQNEESEERLDAMLGKHEEHASYIMDESKRLRDALRQSLEEMFEGIDINMQWVADGLKDAKDEVKEVDVLANTLTNSFTDMFSSIIDGSFNAADALRNLAATLASMIFEQNIARPASEWISAGVKVLLGGLGGGAAKSAPGLSNAAVGNLPPNLSLASQQIPTFGDGGFVDKPTLAIVGEKGPEMIVPMKKYARGDSGMFIGDFADLSGQVGRRIGLPSQFNRWGGGSKRTWIQQITNFLGDFIGPNGRWPQVGTSLLQLYQDMMNGGGMFGGAGIQANFSNFIEQFKPQSQRTGPDLISQMRSWSPQTWAGTISNNLIGGAMQFGREELINRIPAFSASLMMNKPLVGLASFAASNLLGSVGRAGNFPGAEGYTGFASGGVVNSPTVFSQPGSIQQGLMGEAGPEAIMPLGRDSSGNLGVVASGMAPKHVTVNMNIRANDVDSFRRSQKQMTNDLLKVARSI